MLLYEGYHQPKVMSANAHFPTADHINNLISY